MSTLLTVVGDTAKCSQSVGADVLGAPRVHIRSWQNDQGTDMNMLVSLPVTGELLLCCVVAPHARVALGTMVINTQVGATRVWGVLELYWDE